MIDLTTPELRFALSLVSDACVVTRAVHEKLGASHLEKSDLSPVSVADLAVQALAGRRLSTTLAADALVGEESSDVLEGPQAGELLAQIAAFLVPFAPEASPNSIAEWIDRGSHDASGDRYWTLDPVDGTKGFLRGDQYAIALALIENGRVVLGVLGCPNLEGAGFPARGEGLMAVACRGEGAWARPLNLDRWERMRVSAETDPAQARVLRSYEKAHTNASETDLIMQALGIEASAITMDSQAKYASLAAGHAEVLLRLLNPGKETYKERIWDQAAGSIILEESGGTITDLLGHPLDFGQGRTLANNTGVVASNGPLHDAVLEAAQGVCGDRLATL